MKSLLFLIITVLVLSIFYQQGSALQCYECNTFMDEGCDGNTTFLEQFKKECDTKEFAVCRKIVQNIEDQHESTNEKRIIRSCGWINSTYNNKCYQRSGFGGSQEVCSCTEDLCNGSNPEFISIVLIICSIIFKIFYIANIQI